MNNLWRASVVAGALAVIPLWAFGLRAQQSYYGINSPSVDISPLATHTVTVDHGSPAAKAGIVDGDQIPLAHLDAMTRRQLFSSVAFVGLPVSFAVIHHGKARSVTLQPVRIPIFPLNLSDEIFLTISIIAAMLGLLLAIRAWSDGRARIAAALLVLLALESATEGAPLQPGSAAIIWLEIFWSQTVYATAIAAWAFLSVLLVSTYPAARSTAFFWLFKVSGALVVLWVADGLWTTYLMGTAEWTDRTQWLGEFYAIPFAVSSVAVLVGYLHSSGNDRQRLLWLMLAFVPYQAGVAALSFASLSGVQLNASLWMRILELSVPVFMLYGIFVRRVIDIGFVLNRLTVFSILTALVVATFIVVESLLNALFIGMSRTTSITVQLAVALLLGVTIRYPHRYIDHLVDRVLFARRHADERALRQFAEETHAYSDRSVLLDRTTEILEEHAEAGSIGILLLNGDRVRLVRGGYRKVPEAIGADDGMMVALRRWDEPIDTHRIKTALPDGMGFPIAARGQLLGVLFCGTKPDGSAFAPDERASILAVARGVGSALAELQSRRGDVMEEILTAIRRLPEAIVECLKAQSPESSP